MELFQLRYKLNYTTCIDDTVCFDDVVIQRTPTTLLVDTPLAHYVFDSANYARGVKHVIHFLETGDASAAEQVVHQMALFNLATVGV